MSEPLDRPWPLADLSRAWVREATRQRQAFSFPTWLGRPILQLPQDLLAMQELIWQVRPQVIVETGVAHGGSLVFYASMLQLLGGDGFVVGVDVDLRPHNREAIETHPMAGRIRLVEGSSIEPAVVARVHELVSGHGPVMVVLDSHHTHAHVLHELRAYAPMATPGSYVVVFDTAVEHIPQEIFPDRPWGPGDNPLTAVRAYLAETDRLEVDHAIEARTAGITVAPGGYLRVAR